MTDFPKPPFARQKKIPMPGRDAEMDPRPDYGETSYRGSGRLAGRRAIVTGAIPASARRWPSPLPARAPTCW